MWITSLVHEEIALPVVDCEDVWDIAFLYERVGDKISTTGETVTTEDQMHASIVPAKTDRFDLRFCVAFEALESILLHATLRLSVVR